MTLPEFVRLWQAQPFRPFALETNAGRLTVPYPLAAAMAASGGILIADNGRVHRLRLDEVISWKAIGAATDLTEAIAAVDPATLARNAQALSEAMTAEEPAATPQATSESEIERPQLRGAHAPDGRWTVHAELPTRRGSPSFSTVGTGWNVHGIEHFENGTSLYLHHVDHPTLEQRVIIWPPDSGTFDSFAEAQPLATLDAELRARDRGLASAPEVGVEPPAAFFRRARPEFKTVEVDERAEAFGEDDDLDRYEFHLVRQRGPNKETRRNPWLVDVAEEEVVFDLRGTQWDGDFTRRGGTIDLSLRHGADQTPKLALTIALATLTAVIEGTNRPLPLGFFERQLRNFELYQHPDALMAALRAGPSEPKQPEVVVPLFGGGSIEFWGGERRIPLPFLQPRIVDAEHHTLLDLRATQWGAAVEIDATEPAVTLRWLSAERTKNPPESEPLRVRIDLRRQRVTSPHLPGSTSLGMLQALVRRVRGLKWLEEELPAWLAKGAGVPAP